MAKHLQAYFDSENDADAAVTDLRALGAVEATSDRTMSVETRFADIDQTPFIPLYQGSMLTGVSSAMPGYPPLAAVAAASMDGLPEDGERRREGRPVVSAVVDERDYDKAVDIVKRRGGRFE